MAPIYTPPAAGPKPGRPTESEILPPCGTLADRRGQPIVGAHVVALGRDTRAATTDAEGRFCLPSLYVGDTLSLWREGYHSTRIVVGSETMLSLRMAPIAPPADRPVAVVPVPPTSSPARYLVPMPAPVSSPPPAASAPAQRPRITAPVRGERPDLYANETHSIRVAVAEARIATNRARVENTARSHERAADRWETIARRTSGKASVDAHFQSVTALRRAYHLSPTSGRLAQLRAALARFVAMTPKAIPERITAVNWRAELGPQR